MEITEDSLKLCLTLSLHLMSTQPLVSVQKFHRCSDNMHQSHPRIDMGVDNARGLKLSCNTSKCQYISYPWHLCRCHADSIHFLGLVM